ncbi:putative G-protein coupled receptor 149 [Microcaecilia unicolor]|uniref:Probable G-protein coupled receptor 149 n=1 Tax=Microcaecilia unicolor TaxID=1415580 RepID=A0A6P7Z0T1_9AMPH|nr:probable G-protein coupled receptor 149 [Microcaecilia unicolor]
MSLVTPSHLPVNQTNNFIGNQNLTDVPKGQKTFNLLLFCLTFIIILAALLGSIYSVACLLKMPRKTTISVLVTFLSVDDLITVLSGTMFLLIQWSRDALPPPLRTAAAVLYLFQGISSNLKASFLVSYNFYTTKKTGHLDGATRRPVRILWVIFSVWTVSLLISCSPLCGWGTFVPTSWGYFTDCTSTFALFLFVLYLLCFCNLAVFSVPLTHQLLCSDDRPQCLYANYQEISRGCLTPGTPLGSNASSSISPEDPVHKTSRNFRNTFPSSETVVGKKSLGEGCEPDPPCRNGVRESRSGTRLFAQKRFSLILALTKVILWLPMMIQMVVQHIVGYQSLSFETLSFLLTLLAATVTPVFTLSEHWIHLPCGCIINCRRNQYTVSSEERKTKRRGFEFNLSFQKGYGIYKISQENHSVGENSISYHNLNYDSERAKRSQREINRIISSSAAGCSTKPLQESLVFKDIRKSRKTTSTETRQDIAKDDVMGCALLDNTEAFKREDVLDFEKSAFFEGPERRLSHEESRKPDLSDWEWCRSKSERNPRQRSGGALAIPLCAFQGTVSLHAPTGKTLSLSTYEVSSEGQKITPTSKKIEVYRSKSVGHEPNPEDSPTRFPDTNVKIHLEVLEICDNEEAMDTVSIISNISQSSAQARSPSLRYSRKENRFVSCDLGESASYSLFIPTNNPDSDINISIPDTVEAHRQNSKKQHQDNDGYQEEIQLLNKAYRKREEDGKSN